MAPPARASNGRGLWPAKSCGHALTAIEAAIVLRGPSLTIGARPGKSALGPALTETQRHALSNAARGLTERDRGAGPCIPQDARPPARSAPGRGCGMTKHRKISITTACLPGVHSRKAEDLEKHGTAPKNGRRRPRLPSTTATVVSDCSAGPSKPHTRPSAEEMAGI